MCDPLALAGAAMTVGSSVMGGMAASKADAARADVMRNERARQDALDREADDINVRSQDRYQDFGAKQEERAQKLGDYFKEQSIANSAAGAQEAEAAVAPPSSSNITVQEIAKQSAEARDFTDRQGAALGNLRAFGDHLGEISRGQARDAGYIGQVGGFKKGSAAVMPMELEVANSAGAGLKKFGDILGLGGQFAMGQAMQGSWQPPKAPAAANTPTTVPGVKTALPTFSQPVVSPGLVLPIGFGSLPSFAGKSNPYNPF